ncbi:hypothetical protein [Nocardia ignorata]|uniref:Uncharacterized protein n=1 Tax=Nocardia ignorata TaxID=145285 RepID=A0A4R6NZ51_NOCIG|nr:hypothetical protein [Nocardia ignorata]TDP29823.1 hypothetical protein DFR75_11291 [Nocardia ignorata]
MSHFTVTVALPDNAANIQSYLTNMLRPFDENLEVEEFTEDGETYWRNPNAKWDWWTIGGRWTGRWKATPGALRENLVHGEPSWTNRDKPIPLGHCDGGRIHAIDIERTREIAGRQAVLDWNEYAMVIDGTPQHQPWKVFLDRANAASEAAPKPWVEMYDEARATALAETGLTQEEVDALPRSARREEAARTITRHIDDARDAYHASLEYSMDQARKDYSEQPRIAVLRAAEPYKRWFDGPEDTFDHLTRDEFEQLRRDMAVPGYAFLTKDGLWMARGEMGWFGMDNATDQTTDRYLRAANDYIDSLDRCDWLVNVDCHI